MIKKVQIASVELLDFCRSEIKLRNFLCMVRGGDGAIIADISTDAISDFPQMQSPTSTDAIPDFFHYIS